MTTQGEGLQNWIEERRAAEPRLVAVTGGKGGVGKSNFSLNFALAIAQTGRRALLIDCDSGLGNIDVLLGLCPPRHLGHVLSGEATLEDTIVSGPAGLDLLPAASGVEALGKASAAEAGRLLKALQAIQHRYAAVILDTSAGLGPQVRSLLRAAPEVLVVTTPEPTALADAYATLKVLAGFRHPPAAQLVVNVADGAREAEAAVQSIATVSQRFLGSAPGYLGFIPRDPAVPLAVRAQRPFLLASPGCPAGRAVRSLAAAWLGEPVVNKPSRTDIWSVFRSLWRAADATADAVGQRAR